MRSTDASDDWGFDPEPEVAPEHIPRTAEPEPAPVSEAGGPKGPSDRVSVVDTLATAAIGLLLFAWLALIALSTWWLVMRLSG